MAPHLRGVLQLHDYDDGERIATHHFPRLTREGCAMRAAPSREADRFVATYVSPV